MNPSQSVVDSRERERALDPTQSFIVQAPAGSGKTELLTNRLLVLLAGVDEPEEVVAITFTRKAAAEMRVRLLHKLEQARAIAAGTLAEPDSAHERATLQRARAVLARDAERDWQLLQQPNRLRIQTFDSLCSLLARQLPYLSRLGGQANIREDADALYQQAALRTLMLLEEPDYHATLAAFLRHLDNDGGKAQRLLVSMLARREQWQEVVGALSHPQLDDQLHADWSALIAASIAPARELLDDRLQRALMAPAQHAARQLLAAESDSAIIALHDWNEPLQADARDLPRWQALAELLLTKGDDCNWRKPGGINVKLGFPATKSGPDQQAKQLFLEQLALLSEYPFQPLADLRLLCQPDDLRDQSAFLWHLAGVLRLAVAQLWLVFAERNEIDFSQMAQSAIAALGEFDEPSELALALDYKIRHLLVDECQDTSVGQFALLKKLTAGWQPDDGHTLFLVGDPMQSIYRFRKAEVSLFLDARKNGVGAVALQAITLQANFRAQSGLVEWLNAQGPALLAAQEDSVRGAVPYSAAVAVKPALADAAVRCHGFSAGDAYAAAEAERVVQLVQQALPHGSVAILARARSHLIDIATALRAAGIAMEAVDTEPLAQQAVVIDLLQLTRALLHPADRLAWLCVLRAPWCGLTLTDFHALCAGDDKTPLPSVLQMLLQALQQPAPKQPRSSITLANLSADGQQRLLRCAPVLLTALAQQQRLSLATRVSQCWLQLGGPAACVSDDEFAVAQQFFELLEQLDDNSDDVLTDLDRELGKLYARPSSGAAVKLLTMHKSKGLEFDTVILPRLAATTKSDETPLLRWDLLPIDGRDRLLIGTIAGVRSDSEGANPFLKQLEKERAEHERARLLYVALTRAKQRLHLLAALPAETPDKGPASSSLLAPLWPGCRAGFLDNFQQLPGSDDSEPTQQSAPLQRLPGDFALTIPELPAVIETSSSPPEAGLQELLAGDTARAVGTLVHRWLQQWAEQTPPELSALTTLRPLWRKQLCWFGVTDSELPAALAELETALANTLSDPAGLALLRMREDASAEWALTSVEPEQDSRLRQHIIDRSYVDAEGVRWIVDYKTARHDGADVDSFLAERVKEYQPQLQRYADLLRRLETRPIRLALYFPLQQRLFSWDAS
ncbi:UvrD-helicase domain-containing protein [Permianibacter sp. IMCC34836]|uniref:UvrD-helicase domain-containing protein n=1 Tax=Permianibacter fluminis TaxID=2738515 RepID=UPI001556002A|nr:UvrD-helicase domain-containing protein [Permianibacter fluminis]NQD35735.1 UvrD-helicase domain-containing protein [Permianibacter fluminis]